MDTGNFKFKEYVRDNIKDNFSEKKNIRGRVRIYEHKVGDSTLFLLKDTDNLVVFRGRRWLSRKAFNTNSSNDSSQNFKDLFISWFAIGNGGASESNPLLPTSPRLENASLANQGVIESGTRFITYNGKQYHKFDDGYPTFVTDTEIEHGILNQSADDEIIVNVTTTLEANEANNLAGAEDPDDAYQDINEAGLFISDSNSVGTLPTAMHMFSRVTFPTIRKTSNVRYIFSWYIFF